MICEGVDIVFGVGVDGARSIFDGSDAAGVTGVQPAEFSDDVLLGLYVEGICGLCAVLVKFGGVVGDLFSCKLDGVVL